MKHRGRHRRRRRGRALRASLAGTALALTAAATLISTSQAAGGETPGGLSSITSSAELRELQLRESLTDETALDNLTTEMGGSVGVEDVLTSANHVMRDESDCYATEKASLPVEPAVSRAYCWDPADAANAKWLPRSVATSRNNQVILSGWTHAGDDGSGVTGEEGLARVAFVDARDPGNLKYRWVLLVMPQADGKGFEAVRSRLGGMVWYEDKLIVTAQGAESTGRRDDSLYVFDLGRLLRADVTDSDAIGEVEDGWSAHHYRYAMPAIASYTPASGGSCDARDNEGVPCFGSLTLDRTSTPPSVVANEWFGPSREQHARIWRYGLDTVADRTGLLTTGRHGGVAPTEAYETEAAGVRGAFSHQGNWYVGQGAEERDARGTLWSQDENRARAAKCPGERTGSTSYACWGLHTASLSYSPETDELWTLSGPIPERVLYSVRLSDVDSSLG
ncbi:hypothetical protein [Streptomyces adelaidensis]|uniref:hypothetical protein n=1 Tax=Streptomyces adelaidensis TaxID=2796465 RepID=UPI00190422DB|nr:hypothetical protein [Streptomyces adelaidensis]